VSDVVQKKFSWRLVDPDDVPRDLPPQVSTPARHLLHKALLTIRQTGKKRSSDYIAADVVLGQGTFSQVLAARPKTGGQMVAVKKYKKTSDIALQLQEVHFCSSWHLTTLSRSWTSLVATCLAHCLWCFPWPKNP
jgi:hypothetical protein